MVYLISMLATLAVLGGALAVIAATLHGRGVMIVDALAGVQISSNSSALPVRRAARVVRLTGYRPSHRGASLPLRAAA